MLSQLAPTSSSLTLELNIEVLHCCLGEQASIASPYCLLSAVVSAVIVVTDYP